MACSIRRLKVLLLEVPRLSSMDPPDLDPDELSFAARFRHVVVEFLRSRICVASIFYCLGCRGVMTYMVVYTKRKIASTLSSITNNT